MSDALDLSALQLRLEASTRKIASMSEHVGKAKQIKEFSSDRRKRVLALAVVGFLSKGESAAAADHKARATDEYGAMLADLEEQYQSAEIIIAEYEAERSKFDACRSLISMLKQIAGQI